jgi:two-component system sensor histidine kinase MprB
LATRFGDLSFQTRLTIVAAAAVAIAIAAAAVVIYFVVQAALVSQLDESLQQQADATQLEVRTQIVPGTSFGQISVRARPQQFGPAGEVQLVGSDGQTALVPGETLALPVAARDRDVAAGRAASYWRFDYIQHEHVRIYTTRQTVTDELSVAVQVGRPMAEIDRILGVLQLFLGGVALAGVGLAALLGRLVAQAALGPIHRLRAAVDHVTATRDMTERVPDQGSDELGRLAAHFNTMLGALDQSLRTQRQLVADASHELRTPLASLRTNIEVLQRSPRLPDADRERLLHDVVAQVEQLTLLIQDLIDLARGDQAPETNEELRLDWIVSAAVERAVTNWPAVRFQTELGELIVTGDARRLDRAVSNLLDNAGKWSPPGEVVEVRVTDHQVVVRDHGPGIAADDLPYIFDRFWRAPTSRAMPGSGLGLAIVRQVAETHGAVVTAERPDGGGTLMRLEFRNSDS